MKTKSYTVAEATIVWILVLVSFGAAGFIYYHHTSIYKTKKHKIDEKNRKIEAQMRDLDRQIKKAEVEKKMLDRKVKIKEKADKKSREELQSKFADLEKTIVNLPYYDYWPDLVGLIEKLAEEKNVYISNFTMVEQNDLKSRKTQDIFTENVFVLDIEGEYSRIMEYLWNLENAIYLTGFGGTVRWRAVVKVVDGGFTIQELNTEDVTMKLRLQLMTFFRKGETSGGK